MPDVDAIFYPCMSYNFDEGLGDNHYNCPVVAYYPEVLAANCHELEGQDVLSMIMWARTAASDFPEKDGGCAAQILAGHHAGRGEGRGRRRPMRRTPPIWPPCAGAAPRSLPRRAGPGGASSFWRAGPYHADPEINHGIDKLICSLRGRGDYGGQHFASGAEIPHAAF